MLSDQCEIIPPVRIGFRTFVNPGSSIFAAEIGRYCSIGRRVSIGAAKHRLDLQSTHPSIAGAGERPQTTIGHDVWVGDGAVILAGLAIGTGAVIGANAVVTKDVEPYAIVVGVPARLLRYRFDEERRAELLASEWWRFSQPDNELVPEHYR